MRFPSFRSVQNECGETDFADRIVLSLSSRSRKELANERKGSQQETRDWKGMARRENKGRRRRDRQEVIGWAHQDSAISWSVLGEGGLLAGVSDRGYVPGSLGLSLSLDRRLATQRDQ